MLLQTLRNKGAIRGKFTRRRVSSKGSAYVILVFEKISLDKVRNASATVVIDSMAGKTRITVQIIKAAKAQRISDFVRRIHPKETNGEEPNVIIELLKGLK